MTDVTEQLLVLMRRYGVSALSLRDGEWHWNLRIETTALPAQPQAVRDIRSVETLTASSFGTLGFPAGPSGAPATLPRRVVKGEIVAVLAIGPLRRPVLAERDCVLVEALVEAGRDVGYGDPLFSIGDVKGQA